MCLLFSCREERLILCFELTTSRQFLALFGSLKDVVFKWKLMWSRKRLEKKRAQSTMEYILLDRHSRLNTSQLQNTSNQLFLSLSRFDMDLFVIDWKKKTRIEQGFVWPEPFKNTINFTFIGWRILPRQETGSWNPSVHFCERNNCLRKGTWHREENSITTSECEFWGHN